MNLRNTKVSFLNNSMYVRTRLSHKIFAGVALGERSRGASWKHFVGLSEGGLWLRVWWKFGHSDGEVLKWRFVCRRVTSWLGIPARCQEWSRIKWLDCWKQRSAPSKKREEKGGRGEKADDKGKCGCGSPFRGYVKCNEPRVAWSYKCGQNSERRVWNAHEDRDGGSVHKAKTRKS